MQAVYTTVHLCARSGSHASLRGLPSAPLRFCSVMICHIRCPVVCECLWHLRVILAQAVLTVGQVPIREATPAPVSIAAAGPGPECTCDEIQSLTPAAPDILTSADAHLLSPPDLRVPGASAFSGLAPCVFYPLPGPQVTAFHLQSELRLATHVAPTSAGCTHAHAHAGAAPELRILWRSIPARLPGNPSLSLLCW